MGEVIRKFMTKATISEGDDLRYSPNWLVARRGILRVTTDALECGDWRIPYAEMDDAALFSVRQNLIPGYVRRVKAGGRIYKFGLTPTRFWRGELPFPVRREKSVLKYSWFSLAVRVLLLLGLAYLVWKRWR